MPDPMTSTYERVEVITSVQRRRRWSAAEKVRIVEETYLPGNTVSLVARWHCPLFALAHSWTLFSMWSLRDRVANSLGVRPPRLVCGRRAL